MSGANRQATGPAVPAATGLLPVAAVPEPAVPEHQLSLWGTSALSSIAVLVRIAAGFATAKVIAVTVGPTGLALLGQVGSLAAVLSTFASGGINAGVVKYLAERRGDAAETRRIVSTAVGIGVAAALTLGAMLVFGSTLLARILLHDAAYAPVFVVLGITAIPIALNGLLAAALNGNHQIRAYVVLNLAASVLGLAAVVVLVLNWGITGALHAFAVGQGMLFALTLWIAYRTGWIGRLREASRWFHGDTARKLGQFGLMAIATALTLPVAQIVIRNHLGNTRSWSDAGLWQAVWQLSDGYLLLITMTLSVYYLPRLSELRQPSAIRAEIARGFRIWVPLAASLALAIYLSRDWLVWLLFAPEFFPMRELFAFQLLGDVLRIASWLLSFLMVAKAMTRRFVITEVAFGSSFVVLSILMVNAYGLVGVTYAFALNYLLYLVCVYLLVRGYLSHGR